MSLGFKRLICNNTDNLHII